MFTILSKKTLSANVRQIELEAPEIAKRAEPGQFVVLRVHERGERIPLTIAGKDPGRGSITLIFQEVGKSTALLGRLEPGSGIPDVLGPLGHPTHIGKAGSVAVVGGGVGVAEILPVARAFKEAGNTVIGIIGARNKDLLILEPEMKAACDRLLVATDDGSSGAKGFVSDLLKDLIGQQVRIDLVYTVGPVPMMRVVSALTKQYGIRTLVSLNPVMVDGTGMCGACRVSIAGKTKFACVDGPEFDGHEVNWEELTARLSLYRTEEKASLEKHLSECKCRKE